MKNRILTLAVLLTACSGIKEDTGHRIIHQQISKEAALKAKNNLKASSNDDFQPFQYAGIHYRLLSPAVINPTDTYPLVLVLHGSGAVGTDNIAQQGVLVKLWAQPDIRNKYPAYVLAPQFPQRSSNYTADANKNVLVSTPDACLTEALHLIDSLIKVLPVNGRKIYVIGFSMGASSALNALALRPDLFAAAISVSGIPDFKRTSRIPVWLIHGNADHENPFSSDSLFYKTMHDRHMKFWEIDQLEHEVYPELYMSNIIPEWLFKHIY
jgi:predicted peptidase